MPRGQDGCRAGSHLRSGEGRNQLVGLPGEALPFPAAHGACTMAHVTPSCGVTAALCFLLQMIKSLKKAMAPVLSDVSVEWVFPESTEVLVSPISSSCLFPGDRLVGYSIICDTSLYISNPRSVSPHCMERGCTGSRGVGVNIRKWVSWHCQEVSPSVLVGDDG